MISQFLMPLDFSKYVGDSTDLQTSQKVIRSITYHRLTYFV
jgi:hypothetical protein